MTIDIKIKAKAQGVSFFPKHYGIIRECAVAHGLRPDLISLPIQIALEEWREQRRMLALLPEAEREALRRRASQPAVVEFSGELDPVV